MNVLGFNIEISEFIKFFALHICSFIIYIKIVNFKEITLNKKVVILISSIILAFIYTIISTQSDIILAFLISLFLCSIILKYITLRKLLTSILISIVSYAICYFLLVISSVIVVTISMVIFKTTENTIYDHIAISIIIICLSLLFFKIKRFKNGLYFFQRNDMLENVSIFVITIGCVIIYSYYITKKLGNYNDITLLIYPLLAILIIGICMYIWIKKSLDIQYKINLRDKNNKSLVEEIEQLKNHNEKLLNDIYQISKTNHELNHKLNVLNNIVVDMASMPSITKKFKNKYGEDFDILLNEIKETLFTMVNTKDRNNILPSTNNFKIDRALESMQKEATKNSITFELKINGNLSVSYMTEKILSANKLATLLCDHIKNAIIAVNASKKKYKSICVIIGEINNNYGILIYDSGIAFDINVLINIGYVPITSHSDIGGTGYGFMTTFDTIKKLKASLVIEEYEVDINSYTKSVGIIFDRKNEYRILTYRYKEIRKMDKLKRIVVKK
ncbi:MAG: hypothetical protein PHE54_05640 [Bacilli bacterium]|nr:hypothetical protein [Bacilli bacterium]